MKIRNVHILIGVCVLLLVCCQCVQSVVESVQENEHCFLPDEADDRDSCPQGRRYNRQSLRLGDMCQFCSDDTFQPQKNKCKDCIRCTVCEQYNSPCRIDMDAECNKTVNSTIKTALTHPTIATGTDKWTRSQGTTHHPQTDQLSTSEDSTPTAKENKPSAQDGKDQNTWVIPVVVVCDVFFFLCVVLLICKPEFALFLNLKLKQYFCVLCNKKSSQDPVSSSRSQDAQSPEEQVRLYSDHSDGHSAAATALNNNQDTPASETIGRPDDVRLDMLNEVEGSRTDGAANGDAGVSPTSVFLNPAEEIESDSIPVPDVAPSIEEPTDINSMTNNNNAIQDVRSSKKNTRPKLEALHIPKNASVQSLSSGEEFFTPE